MKKKSNKEEAACSRRDFIKIGGAVAAGLQVGAVAGAGIAAGNDPSTHTGWQHLGESTQSIDAGEERQQGMGNRVPIPQQETAPETTGGEIKEP